MPAPGGSVLLRPENCDHGDDDYNEGDDADGDYNGDDGDDDYNEGVDGDDSDDGYDPSAHQDDWADKRMGEEADRVTEWRGHLFNFAKFQ